MGKWEGLEFGRKGKPEGGGEVGGINHIKDACKCYEKMILFYIYLKIYI